MSEVNENRSKDAGEIERARIEVLITRSIPVTLTLGCWVMYCSAYCLIKMNIRVKFNEKCPKGSGDMERTRNSRVNSMTLTCDLESR